MNTIGLIVNYSAVQFENTVFTSIKCSGKGEHSDIGHPYPKSNVNSINSLSV